jgi:hypothetical protein
MVWLPVMNSHLSKVFGCARVALVALVSVSQAHAYALYKTEQAELNADLDAEFGVFHSEESYAQVRTSSGSQSWQEGFVKYGLSGSYALKSDTRVYGAARLISTATWGDGDAAGFTTGSESRTNFEDAFVGWKSGNAFSALGKNGIDISAGRQTYTIGSGFLVYGDAVNFGKGYDKLAPKSLDRGGAYYLAARESFDNTVILRLGQSKNLRGDIFWLNSDNEGQAETELAGVNAEYEKSHYGTLGLTYLKGLSVNNRLAEFLGYTNRDGQDTFSIRAEGSAGVEHLLLAGEYVHQDNGSAGNEKAWYLGAGWTFAGTPWKPDIGARYSSFSSEFDPLFYGLSSGYGTWYQGEVAGNYAGPFNTNAEISHLYLNAQPLPSLTLGVLFFDFQTKDKDLENLDAREWDIYAEWEINDHFSVSPLIGFYAPDKSAGQGGVQLGNNHTNTYAQMTVTASF